MEIQVRDQIIMMLKSKDPEMMALATVIFCQQSPTFMEYLYIERTLKYGEFYYSDNLKPFLAKMSRCTK